MTEPQFGESYRHAETRVVHAAGVDLAYRELGPRTGVPLVALTHLGANLDGWDHRVIDGLARDRRVVAVGYRGVGDSAGRVRDSIDEMAQDAIAVIRALGLDRVDLFGLSMGGMVAQAVIAQAPELVERLILAGSGPAGGPGLTAMTGVMVRSTVRATVTFTDPRVLLFFTRTAAGKTAARDYLSSLSERGADREKAVPLGVLRAQLAAVHAWGSQEPADLSRYSGPTLIVHGDGDRMVQQENADALARRLPGAVVTMFPDSGHGVVFQNHRAFVADAGAFLRRA